MTPYHKCILIILDESGGKASVKEISDALAEMECFLNFRLTFKCIRAALYELQVMGAA